MLLLVGVAWAAPSPWSGPAESAALKVGTTARQLAQSAGRVSGEGRIGRLTVLRTDADDLVKRADALARLTEAPLPPEEP